MLLHRVLAGARGVCNYCAPCHPWRLQVTAPITRSEVLEAQEVSETMIDVKHCAGCHDDFYNGHNEYGVKECWGRKTAQLVERVLIHIDQPPPYRNLKVQQLPSCYKRQRFVSVAPTRIGADGYWKS